MFMASVSLPFGYHRTLSTRFSPIFQLPEPAFSGRTTPFAGSGMDTMRCFSSPDSLRHDEDALSAHPAGRAGKKEQLKYPHDRHDGAPLAAWATRPFTPVGPRCPRAGDGAKARPRSTPRAKRPLNRS